MGGKLLTGLIFGAITGGVTAFILMGIGDQSTNDEVSAQTIAISSGSVFAVFFTVGFLMAKK